jgi:hypothetical protein
MIRRFLRLNQIYDNTTIIQAAREIELLICNGRLEVIVASTAELEEGSVKASDIGVGEESLGVRVLIGVSVTEGESEENSAGAKDRLDVNWVGSSPGASGGAAMILK